MQILNCGRKSKKTRTGFYYQMSINSDSRKTATSADSEKLTRYACLSSDFRRHELLGGSVWLRGKLKTCLKTAQAWISSTIHIHLKPSPLLSFFFFLDLARKVSRRCNKFHTECCSVSHCIASCVKCRTRINFQAKTSLQAQVWLHYFPLYSSFVWFHLLILFTVEHGIIWCLIVFKHVTCFSSLVSEVHGADNIIGDRAEVHFPSLQKYPG